MSSLSLKLLTAWLCLLSLKAFSSPVDNQALSSRQASFCSSATLPALNYSQTQIAQLRLSRSNVFGDNFSEVFQYYNSSSSNTYISAMRWEMALLLTLLSLVVLSFGLFIATTFFLRKEYRNRTIYKAAAVTTFILLAVFIALFITMLVFLGLAFTAQKRAQCQFLNTEAFLLNGQSGAGQGEGSYLGLQQMAAALAKFPGEAPALGETASAASAILAPNLPGLASAMTMSLTNLYVAYRDSVTSTPFGGLQRPLSILELTPYISDQAQAEFRELQRLVGEIDQGARSALQIGTNASANSTQQAAALLVNTVNAVQGDLFALGEAIWERALERLRLVDAGYWTIFAASITVIALVSFSLVLAVLVYRSNLYDFKGRLANILLITSAIFVIGFGIAVAILMAGELAVSTFCSVLARVNSGDLTVLDGLAVALPGQSRAILGECLGGAGDLSSFLVPPSNASDQTSQQISSAVIGLLNGLLSGILYQNSSSKATRPASLEALLERYSNITAGLVEDQAGVFSSLQTLNSLVGCANRAYALTDYACKYSANATSPSCIGIKEASSFAALNCSASQSTAESLFWNLRAYVQSEGSLLGRFSQDLGNSLGTSPMRNYADTKSALNSILPSISEIAGKLPQTISAFSLGNTTNSSDLLYCGGLKEQMALLEDQVCFQLNYWLFILLAIAGVGFVILALALWGSWVFVREMRAVNQNVKGSRRPEELIEKRMANLNDRENYPNY